jgi:hypothetical protein|tara:strand:+ start:1205 stop:1459 length:255 start_codon:yes stop_codon:yes gene_type:complete
MFILDNQMLDGLCQQAGHSSRRRLQKIFEKNISISAVGGTETDKSFVDTRNALDYQLPSYDQMISEIFEIIMNNSSLYSQCHIK